jgi:hypothetical protein
MLAIKITRICIIQVPLKLEENANRKLDVKCNLDDNSRISVYDDVKASSNNISLKAFSFQEDFQINKTPLLLLYKPTEQ